MQWQCKHETAIRPHNLTFYDVKQTVDRKVRARAAPRTPCARLPKEALGPNVRILGALNWLPADDRRSNMKLDDATFRRLRRLAPVLDDVLNAGEVEHADQAADLISLAQLCSQLFDAYHEQHPGENAQAQLDAFESQ
jgi:hypothetical protein